MRAQRLVLTLACAMAFSIAAVSAQQDADPAGRPLFPPTIVSHVADGTGGDGVHSKTVIFVTNAGGLPLAADLAFVPDGGQPVAHHLLSQIDPGTTVPVPVRDIVGPDAAPFL